jgi:hypothetical protein
LGACVPCHGTGGRTTTRTMATVHMQVLEDVYGLEVAVEKLDAEVEV